jgi:SSS family transporter
MLVQFAVIGYVLLMLPIGLYARHKVKNSNDYVLAGRSLPFYMTLATVFATWFGSESILGAGATFAQEGFRGVIEDPFGAALCLIIAGFFFNRKLYRLNFLTIGDYFKHRYNVLISTFLSIVIVISYFGWVAAQLLAMGLVLSVVIPALSLTWAILLAAGVVVSYTFFGGMYSIAWLDTIESVVIIIGLFVVLIFALTKVGGIDAVIASVPANFWHILPERRDSLTEWIIFITALMTMGFGSIPQQDIYQRAMSAKSEGISMWASIFGGVLYLTIVMIPLLIALIAKMLLPEVFQNNPEQITLSLVRFHTPGWVQVFFFGALISAIVSTASGALLAPGTLLAENIIKPFFAEISDNLRLHIIRLAVIIVAFGGIILALNKDASIYHLVRSAYSLTLVSAFVPLAVGLYSKKATSFGALVSIIAGISVWQYADRLVNSPIPSTFYGFIASCVGMLIGTLIGRFILKEEKLMP